jgi:hypothetical protein
VTAGAGDSLTGRPREYASVTDAIPDAPAIAGAHDDYPKGEVSSIGDLVGDIATDLSTLIRQEVELAKAEAQQSAKQAGKGAGLLSAAGLGGWFALLFASIALWWWIGTALLDGLGWAALIVAVLWAIVATVLAVMGRNQLRSMTGMPRTVETAKAVPQALKGNEENA